MTIPSLSIGLLLAASHSSAPRLAVLDVVARIGVRTELAQGVSDALLDQVRQHNPGVQVIGAEDIRTILGMVKLKQQVGCAADVSCLTELGGALGAGQVVVATLGRFGDTYLLSARLIDVVHSRVLTAASERLPDKNDAALLTAIDHVVAHLFPSSPPPAAPKAALAAVPPPVPEQVLQPVFQEDEVAKPAAHSHVLSLALGGGAIAALAVAGVGLANVLSFQSYAPLSHGAETTATVQGNVASANLWANVGIACLVLAAAGAAGAVITW